MSIPFFSHAFLKPVTGLLLAGMLVACGGGSDAPDTSATAPGAMARPEVAQPPATDATAEITQSGRMNYLIYRVNPAGPAIEATHLSAVVTNAVSGGAGTLTLNLSPAPLELHTTNAWESSDWPVTHQGVFGLQGHAVLVCDKTAPAESAGLVGMSHNMQAVTTLDELKGLRFDGHDCSTAATVTTGSFEFGNDGSLSADGEAVDAAEVAALFSQEGLDIEAQNLKLRAYKIRQGDRVRHAAVLLFVETDATTGTRSHRVELLLN